MSNAERIGISEAALITGMSKAALIRFARDGVITGERVADAWLFDEASLRSLFASAEARVPIEAYERAIAKRTPCLTYMRSLPVDRGKSNRVYIIRAGEFAKIGIAFNPKARLRELQVGNPVELELLCHFIGGWRHESYLHAYFAAEYVRGEWFRTSERLLAFAKSRERAR